MVPKLVVPVIGGVGGGLYEKGLVVAIHYISLTNLTLRSYAFLLCEEIPLATSK